MELGNLNKAILNPKIAIIESEEFFKINMLCYKHVVPQGVLMVLRETVRLIILARSSSK